MPRWFDRRLRPRLSEITPMELVRLAQAKKNTFLLLLLFLF